MRELEGTTRGWDREGSAHDLPLVRWQAVLEERQGRGIGEDAARLQCLEDAHIGSGEVGGFRFGAPQVGAEEMEAEGLVSDDRPPGPRSQRGIEPTPPDEGAAGFAECIDSPGVVAPQRAKAMDEGASLPAAQIENGAGHVSRVKPQDGKLQFRAVGGTERLVRRRPWAFPHPEQSTQAFLMGYQGSVCLARSVGAGDELAQKDLIKLNRAVVPSSRDGQVLVLVHHVARQLATHGSREPSHAATPEFPTQMGCGVRQHRPEGGAKADERWLPPA